MGGLTVAGKNLGERCFSGTIAANQANFIALIDAEVDLVHQDPWADANLEVAHANHLSFSKGFCRKSDATNEDTSLPRMQHC